MCPDSCVGMEMSWDVHDYTGCTRCQHVPTLSHRHRSDAYWSASGFSATAACPLQTAFLRNLSAELLLTKHQCAALSATNWTNTTFPTFPTNLGQILAGQGCLKKLYNGRIKVGFVYVCEILKPPSHGKVKWDSLHYVFVALQLLSGIGQCKAILTRTSAIHRTWASL
jgi:hypothetical protein